VNLVKRAVNIPVVASSGAGAPGDFIEVFEKTGTEAALAAGIFHRGEVGIDEVKLELEKQGMAVRRCTLEP
jgi:glutamine amidotransferase/cyclase